MKTIKKERSNYQAHNRLNSENTEDKNALRFFRKNSENNFGTAAFYKENDIECENTEHQYYDADNETKDM